jgi:integrase
LQNELRILAVRLLRDYLVPSFGKMALKDITPEVVDEYFARFDGGPLMHESVEKVKTVLGSILRQAVRYGRIHFNPVAGLVLPRDLKRTARHKHYLTPEQFDELLHHIPEPYSSMLYVAIWSGLRVSELVGLKWNDVGPESIMVDERFCRGDWGHPKSEASNAMVPVRRQVIARIERLKLLTVDVRAGCAVRHYKVVRSDGPDDLVFQSVRTGKPMRDNNVLSRHIKPAGRELGLPWVNWRCLRTSCARPGRFAQVRSPRKYRRSCVTPASKPPWICTHR